MPRISIIIPVYNVELYLSDCLDSILNQSFRDFEIICINDGSTDNSGVIIDNYIQENGNKIVYEWQENKGLSEARNLGLKLATGEYVCFVDSDDMLVVDALSVLNKAIMDNPEVQIFNYEVERLLYENGIEDVSKCLYYKVKEKYEKVRTGSDLLVEMIINGDYIESANLLLIKREWLLEKQLLFTPNALYEDSIFSIDCFLNCNSMLHISRGLYVYRQRDNSIMTTRHTYKQLKWRVWQYREVLRRMFSSAPNEGVESALSEYAKLVLGSIKNIYHELEDEEKIKIVNMKGIDELLVETMGLNIDSVLNNKLRLNGLLRTIESAEDIVIYGAGNVGKKIYEFLREQRLACKVKGFAVTDNVNVFDIEGIPVRQINEYKDRRIDLIIIATVNAHYEIMVEAKKVNSKTIIAIDRCLEREIDELLIKSEDEKRSAFKI